MYDPTGGSRRPTRQPLLLLPSQVSFLVSAMVVVHLVRQFLPRGLDGSVIFNFGFIPARLWTIFETGQASALLSGILTGLVPFVGYAFLHADWVHVGFNLLWMMAFATAIARRLGSDSGGQWRFYLFFCMTAAAGAIGHMIFYPYGNIPLVGASGAVAGFMGGALRFIFTPGGMSRHSAWPLAPVTDLRVLVFSGVFVLFNLLAGMSAFGVVSEGGEIAWQAHLGGFFAGLFLFPLFDRPTGRNNGSGTRYQG